MTSDPFRSGRWALVILLSAGTTCKEAVAPTPESVGRVAVSGPNTVFLGHTAQLVAVVYGTFGDTMRNAPVTWRSDDSAIASVNASGLVTGNDTGTTTITASAAGVPGTVSMAVHLVPVAKVDVAPQVDSLFIGSTRQLTVTTRDSVGSVLLGRIVVWSSSDTAKAIVSPTGLVMARAAGAVAISATSEGRTGGAFLSGLYHVASVVLPDSFRVPHSHTLRPTVTLLSGDGHRITGRAVTWGVLDTSIVAPPDSALLVPRALGATHVWASSSGLADTALLRVVPDSVAAFGISKLQFELTAGTVTQVVASVGDGTGHDAVGNAVQWTSSDTTVAIVTPDSTSDRVGDVHARARGVALITATSGSHFDTTYAHVHWPITRLRLAPDSIMLHPGRGKPFLPSLLTDSLGNVILATSYVTYAVLDTTVAVIAAIPPSGASGLMGVRPGRTVLVGHVPNSVWEDSADIVVADSGAAPLDWGVPALSVATYDTVHVRLSARDSSGAPSPQPLNITLVSGNPAVATPKPTSITGLTTDTTITISAHGGGHTTITASAGNIFASLSVEDTDRAVVSFTLAPTPPSLLVGDTLRLRVTAIGTDGNTHPYPLNWLSSDVSRATIDQTGLVSAVGAGRVETIVSFQGFADTARFVVQSTNSPIVDSTTPVVAMPDSTATIHGSGFDPDPTANTVDIEGVPVTVTAATTDSVSVRLPARAAFACRATHRAPLVISSGGRVKLDSLLLAPAPQATLAVGERRMFSPADAECTELRYGADYLVSVLNTSPSPDVAAPFEYVGEGGIRAGASVVGTSLTRLQASGAASEDLSRMDRDSIRRVTMAHRRILEANRSVVASLGPPVPLLQAALRQRPAIERSVTATIGGVARIRVPQVDQPDFCFNSTAIDARLVYNGTHAKVFEDVSAPIAGQMDNTIDDVGAEFDASMFPLVVNDFGNPLALDSLLDNDGKIAIVLTPQVNQYGGVLGFVVSCDFYPEAVAPSSNTGEILYLQVPTRRGTGFDAYTQDYWRWIMRATILHETKHLAAFAERLSRGAPLEESWLEEATAVLAEEIWVRQFGGATWKGNSLYSPALYCEVRPTAPGCATHPYAMFNAFAYLYDFLSQQERHSVVGPTDPTDGTFYGSAWSLVRWTVDQYAATEAAFLKSLVQEPVLTGIANLEARSGHSFPELLENWSISVTQDDHGIPLEPDLTFPSWNLADVFYGMNQDFPSDFSQTYPSYLRVDAGTFEQDVQIPGGTMSQLLIPGPTGMQLLRVLGESGAPLPAYFRVEVLRAH